MSQEADSLGLDKPIKLGRLLKIPKITDELLFDRNRGIPYVIQNYQKVARGIRKNDKIFSQKAKELKLSKGALHQLKVESEMRNLESVLQFYQLWCHGLFPRATFTDCMQMVRKYKSARVKIYRRELIEKEIHDQRIKEGIITEDAAPEDENGIDEDDLYDAPDNGIAAVNEEVASAKEVNDDDSEDDWGFLSVRRRPNGLFVGDDEESGNDDEQDGQNGENDGDANNQTKTSSASEPRKTQNPTIDDDNDGDNDEFDDDDFDYSALPNPKEQVDEFEDELEIMREMGM